MPKVIFVGANGSEHTVEIAAGMSLMEGAVRGMVPGIDADCGGACSCATCMVYVPPEWNDRLPAMDKSEDAMLAFAPLRQATSRLSCQIGMTPALDGLRVSIPQRQQ